MMICRIFVEQSSDALNKTNYGPKYFILQYYIKYSIRIEFYITCRHIL